MKEFKVGDVVKIMDSSYSCKLAGSGFEKLWRDEQPNKWVVKNVDIKLPTFNGDDFYGNNEPYGGASTPLNVRYPSNVIIQNRVTDTIAFINSEFLKKIVVKLDPIPWWEAAERILNRKDEWTTGVYGGEYLNHINRPIENFFRISSAEIKATWYPGKTTAKGEVIE